MRLKWPLSLLIFWVITPQLFSASLFFFPILLILYV